VREGPWTPGERYRIVQTVQPFTSSVEVFLDGERDGPRVEVDISGSTVDMVRDAKVGFGLRQIFGGAFFPYYGATYHDLEVWADVAPPVP
jgi:hypothetical protein